MLRFVPLFALLTACATGYVGHPRDKPRESKPDDESASRINVGDVGVVDSDFSVEVKNLERVDDGVAQARSYGQQCTVGKGGTFGVVAVSPKYGVLVRFVRPLLTGQSGCPDKTLFLMEPYSFTQYKAYAVDLKRRQDVVDAERAFIRSVTQTKAAIK